MGGALRKYLDSKGELPEESLIAGAPINVRVESEGESSGNQVSMMTIDMSTDIDVLGNEIWRLMRKAERDQVEPGLGEPTIRELTMMV